MVLMVRLKLRAVNIGAYICRDKIKSGRKKRKMAAIVRTPTAKLIKKRRRAISRLTSQFFWNRVQPLASEETKLRFSKTRAAIAYLIMRAIDKEIGTKITKSKV